MTNTYTWTTPKGAEIELTITVEHITEETRNIDGYEYTATCDNWTRTVESCKLNGKETALKQLWQAGDVDCILIDKRGANRILVAMPEDVANAIYGAERAANAAKLDRELDAAAAYEAHRDMMRKVMGY